MFISWDSLRSDLPLPSVSAALRAYLPPSCTPLSHLRPADPLNSLCHPLLWGSQPPQLQPSSMCSGMPHWPSSLTLLFSTYSVQLRLLTHSILSKCIWPKTFQVTFKIHRDPNSLPAEKQVCTIPHSLAPRPHRTTICNTEHSIYCP